MNYRLFATMRQPRSTDFLFSDDIEDADYASDQSLSFNDRCNASYSSLLLKEKQGVAPQLSFGQSLLPNTVFPK